MVKIVTAEELGEEYLRALVLSYDYSESRYSLESYINFAKVSGSILP